MSWFNSIGGWAQLAGTAYSIYSNERSRRDIKANPGNATMNVAMAALGDPDSPTYRRMLATERDRQMGRMMDIINRSHIQRRRAAAAGAEEFRSEREDESRHRALARAAEDAENSAHTQVRNRLMAAAGIAPHASKAYNETEKLDYNARKNTVGQMAKLIEAIGNQNKQTAQNTRTENTSGLWGGGAFQQGGGTETINWTGTGSWDDPLGPKI